MTMWQNSSPAFLPIRVSAIHPKSPPGLCFGRILSGLALGFPGMLLADPTTIDPDRHHAWAANIGWLDFRGGGPTGGAVGEYILSGYVYSANCGWISLGDGTPTDGINYSNTSSSDFGVNVVPSVASALTASLRGYAYGANIGWIHFESTGNPRIDVTTGAFRGYAWSANCGWINLGELGVALETDSMVAGTDSDGDQIADAFELSYYPAGLGIMGIGTDQDGDGVSDRDEYLADTDPLDNTSALRITAFNVNSTRTLATLTWTSRDTRLYRLWATEDINVPWTPGESNIRPAGTLTTQSFVYPPASHRFYRIEAVRPLIVTPP